MRIWLDSILKKELQLVVDWSKVNKEDYFLAMERSPVKDVEIKTLLKAVLTDKITDRKIALMQATITKAIISIKLRPLKMNGKHA